MRKPLLAATISKYRINTVQAWEERRGDYLKVVDDGRLPIGHNLHRKR
jgi:hypothetical protein